MTLQGPLHPTQVSVHLRLHPAPTKSVSDLRQLQCRLSTHSIPLHLENKDKINAENGKKSEIYLIKYSEMKRHFISKFPNQNILSQCVSPILDVVKPPIFLTSTSTCMCECKINI